MIFYLIGKEEGKGLFSSQTGLRLCIFPTDLRDQRTGLGGGARRGRRRRLQNGQRGTRTRSAREIRRDIPRVGQQPRLHEKVPQGQSKVLLRHPHLSSAEKFRRPRQFSGPVEVGAQFHQRLFQRTHQGKPHGVGLFHAQRALFGGSDGSDGAGEDSCRGGESLPVQRPPRRVHSRRLGRHHRQSRCANQEGLRGRR